MRESDGVPEVISEVLSQGDVIALVLARTAEGPIEGVHISRDQREPAPLTLACDQGIVRRYRGRSKVVVKSSLPGSRGYVSRRVRDQMRKGNAIEPRIIQPRSQNRGGSDNEPL